jgi:hypothetical protein
VASAGDVNGDGYADVIVGASEANVFGYEGGNAYVYLGSATGLATVSTTTLLNTNGRLFGFSVASAGDVNGDGYGDVIIGGYGSKGTIDGGGFPSFAGMAIVYLGSATGVTYSGQVLLRGLDIAGEWFGYSVACAGDVNGDGYADVAVGAAPLGGTGSAYVYLGSGLSTSTTPATSLTGPSPMAMFGVCVFGASD